MISPIDLKREEKIYLTAKGVIRFIFSIICFLVFADLLNIVFRQFLLYKRAFFNFFDEYFNLDYEFNVPTVFSFFILLLSSALLFFIRISNTNKKANLYWLILSIIFLLLSAWILPYGIFCLIIAFAFIKFLISLPKQTTRLFILSGYVYIFGALCLEILEGYIKKQYGEILYYKFINTLAETLEMSGILIFIYALLDYIAPNNSKITIAIKN